MTETQSPIRSPELTFGIWLSAALCLRGIGLAVRYLWHPYESETELFEWLLFDRAWPEPVAQRIDDGWLVLYLVVGLICWGSSLTHWWRGHPRAAVGSVPDQNGARAASPGRVRKRFVQMVVTLLLAACLVWEVAIAAVKTIRGGEAFSEWTFGEHALRIAVPLALCVLSAPVSRRVRIVSVVVRTATAITFFAHGVKALAGSPVFVTMILSSAARLGQACSQGWAQRTLVVIGAIDLAVAVLLIVTRFRWVPPYMAVWGGGDGLCPYLRGRLPRLGRSPDEGCPLRRAVAACPSACSGPWPVSKRWPRPASEGRMRHRWHSQTPALVWVCGPCAVGVRLMKLGTNVDPQHGSSFQLGT